MSENPPPETDMPEIDTPETEALEGEAQFVEEGAAPEGEAPAGEAAEAVPATLVLYQFSYSPSAEKVRRAIHQKGVEHQTVEVSWFDRSPVQELSNQHQVPVLRYGDTVIGPSSIACMDFIEDNFEGPTLYPGYSRGLSHVLNEYNEKQLLGLVFQIFFPAAASALNNADFDADVKRLLGKTPQELWDNLPNVAQEYGQHLSYLNDHLSGHKWMAGLQLSAADHIIYSGFWAAMNNPKFAEMEGAMGLGHLDGWFDRMKEWMWNAPM